MKSVKITFLLAGIAGAMFLGSCSKQEPMNDLARTVQQAARQPATPAPSVAREVVTAREDFDKVFMALTTMMDENTTVQIKSVEGGGAVFTLLTTKPGKMPTAAVKAID